MGKIIQNVESVEICVAQRAATIMGHCHSVEKSLATRGWRGDKMEALEKLENQQPKRK